MEKRHRNRQVLFRWLLFYLRFSFFRKIRPAIRIKYGVLNGLVGFCLIRRKAAGEFEHAQRVADGFFIGFPAVFIDLGLVLFAVGQAARAAVGGAKRKRISSIAKYIRYD